MTANTDHGAARIPATEVTGIKGAMIRRFATRVLGRMPDAIGVYWHHQPVLMAMQGFGAKVRKWDSCDEQLKTFAHMVVAAKVGCSWCLDYNYFEAQNKSLDVGKARQVPRWRESTAFSSLEREVLEYAEAMTESEPTVTDEMVASLRSRLGDRSVIELTAVIAFANLSSRANVALGVGSDGFASACGLAPLPEPSGARPRLRGLES